MFLIVSFQKQCLYLPTTQNLGMIKSYKNAIKIKLLSYKVYRYMIAINNKCLE